MKRTIYSFFSLYLFGGLLLLVACKPQIVGPLPQLGKINPFPYVAIGDGYTAGFSNGDLGPLSTKGLYRAAQEQSFPKLLSEQLASFEAFPFEQNLAYGTGSGYRRLRSLDSPYCELLAPIPVFRDTLATASWQHEVESPQEIHNLGMPHLRVSQVASDSFGRNSLFFQRMASPSQSDYLTLVSARELSFFSLWLGMEDMLDFAITGGVNREFTLTGPQKFAQSYNLLLASIDSAGQGEAKGVVGNLPDLTTFPYFQTVEKVYRSIEDCDAPSQPVFVELDQTTEAVREAREADLILLPAKEEIGKENGGGSGKLGLSEQNPIPDFWVLDAEEVQAIQQMTLRYNMIIDSLVDKWNEKRSNPWLAKADLQLPFEHVAEGMTEDGVEMSAIYLNGGIFSTDGLYLTPRGNALVANSFIEAINAFPAFEAQIPTINLTDYSGVEFP
jgi:hypothetical protein